MAEGEAVDEGFQLALRAVGAVEDGAGEVEVELGGELVVDGCGV